MIGKISFPVDKFACCERVSNEIPMVKQFTPS